MQMKLNGESHVSYIHSGMDEIEKRNHINQISQKSIHLFKSRISITATEFQVISSI